MTLTPKSLTSTEIQGNDFNKILNLKFDFKIWGSMAHCTAHLMWLWITCVSVLALSITMTMVLDKLFNLKYYQYAHL